MKAFNLNHCNSSPAPKEWWAIPEINKAKPKDGYTEISLQILDGLPKGLTLVQWHGAKNGFWYPCGDIFMIKENQGTDCGS
jgi:hypothetical protein